MHGKRNLTATANTTSTTRSPWTSTATASKPFPTTATKVHCSTMMATVSVRLQAGLLQTTVCWLLTATATASSMTARSFSATVPF